jgi:hypothetical protein
MLFTLFIFVAELLLILFPGLVLHRALAQRVLVLDDKDSAWSIDEIDLLLFGLLPGLALANTVGTILAVFHIFYWWAYLASVTFLVAWRWRDALATLSAVGELVARSFRSLLRGNLMVLVAIAIFLQTGAGMLVEAQLPSGNVDVWNHNFPLAQSIVAHHGFVLPQINSMFYGTYPIFFHMFFALGLLFFDSVLVAKSANAMIYLGFLVSLLAFARHARAVAAVLVSILVINAAFFSTGTADVMTDIGRVTFSALAFAFGYQYFRTGRVYFLLASGLVAGGAIAGKYTELLTPILIGTSLLAPLFFRKSHAWRAVWMFVAATAVAGAYPYLRNLILLHNPIYPFLFAHPGISDESMQAIQTEVFVRPASPGLTKYSQNLLSLQGWRDFVLAVNDQYLRGWKLLYYLLALIVAGMVFLRSRALLLFALWTFAMWVFWYRVGQINPRWGMTPIMLLLLLGYLAIVGSIDRCVEEALQPGFWRRSPTWSGVGDALRRIGFTRVTPTAALRIVLAICAIVIGGNVIQRVHANGMSDAFPSWMDRKLAVAAVQPDGIRNYLAHTREGYEVYRYIGEHDLRMVLQPYDNGSSWYQVIYSGKEGDRMVPWRHLPSGPVQYDDFLRNNEIRYFVYCPTMDPVHVHDLGNGAGNPRHDENTYDLMRYLLPGSRLILTDPFGWELREMSPDRLK